MKDHEIKEIVNALTSIAKNYHDHQSLRERIAHIIVNPLKSQESQIIYMRAHIDKLNKFIEDTNNAKGNRT